MAPINFSSNGSNHGQTRREPRADYRRASLRIAYLRNRQLELARHRMYIESAEFALEAKHLAQNMTWSVWT